MSESPNFINQIRIQLINLFKVQLQIICLLRVHILHVLLLAPVLDSFYSIVLLATHHAIPSLQSVTVEDMQAMVYDIHGEIGRRRDLYGMSKQCLTRRRKFTLAQNTFHTHRKMWATLGYVHAVYLAGGIGFWAAAVLPMKLKTIRIIIVSTVQWWMAWVDGSPVIGRPKKPTYFDAAGL